MINTKKTDKNYIIKVTEDLLISKKRVKYSWKNLYGTYKTTLSENTTLEQKLLGKTAKIAFETKNYGPRIVRMLFDPKTKITTKSIGFWTFLDKPKLEPLDVVANALRITKSNYNDISEEEYKKIVKKLKRKLYKHRKHHQKTKIVTSNSPFGNLIKIIDFGLNCGKKKNRKNFTFSS